MMCFYEDPALADINRSPNPFLYRVAVIIHANITHTVVGFDSRVFSSL